MRSTSAVALALAATALGSTACFHSTELAATWHDPHATQVSFRRGVAVFVTRDEALRRTVEDKIAASFANVVPSYTVMPAADSTIGRDEAAARLRAAGFDGAIMMRVADVSVRPSYVDGTYWYDRPYGFGGYWNYAWATPYDPGYVVADRVVTIETQIYSLADDRLIFAARSETTNPSSAGALTASVIRHIRDRLRKDGLMASGATALCSPSCASSVVTAPY
ncbi:MAG TPA: hypothetical protein VN706_04070 [Gemmatimonadaceae bacterium]|nr:hypothetical protein [Gemmatimonadaceae bacterium]